MGSLYGTPVSARSSVAQIRRFGAARPAMLVDGAGAHNGGYACGSPQRLDDAP
jgi:hypothetical protein